MAEPLKHVYSRAFLDDLGARLHDAYSPFDAAAFAARVLREPWESLPLKQRMRKLTLALGDFLPKAYGDALQVLLSVHDAYNGLQHLVFPDFVKVFGTSEEDWEHSVRALESFTKRSTAEFAVRPFLLRNSGRMMRQMEAWAEHDDEHVRRLASEGCRPRLPWGQALPMFRKNPAPIVPVLERLKADPSLYVRKSVANNLNDIAKDHPDLVLDIARRWRGSDSRTDWIVRRGCRTLIRRGHPVALALFGYAGEEDGAEALAETADITASREELAIGGSCELRYAVTVREGEPAKLRIEYGIDFVKKNGRTSRKLFLLADKTVPGGGRVTGSRMHRFADLSTRRHYPGNHRIVLLVNGREVASTSVMLTGCGSEGPEG